MTIYYVCKTGSDGNDGLSAANAFITIDHASINVAAKGAVYTDSGRYDESASIS